MDRKYLAFDLEIAKILPDDVDNLKAHRPLGICCAAVLAANAEQPRLWYSSDAAGMPLPTMSRQDLSELVDFLKAQLLGGYTVITWNGLGFDFDILAEESGRLKDCRRLAIDHIDLMFHIFCEKGFAVSLEAAAKAIGSRGKPPDIEAKMVPKLWAAGETDKVLSYVANDCKLTLEVATVSERRGHFSWITRRGTDSDLHLRSGWLTVRDAMRLPDPDTSWMSSPPWPRSRFTAWLHAVAVNFGRAGVLYNKLLFVYSMVHNITKIMR